MKRVIFALMPLATACVISDADVAGGALASLAVTPAATDVNVFTVEVAGTLTIHYASPEPALVEYAVDGATVLTQSLDVAAALSVDLAATLPLHEGPNHIVALVRYRGEVLSQEFVVNAAMVAPVVTLPVWTPTYVAHAGLSVAGAINVQAEAAYDVASVDLAVDGGPWRPAVAGDLGEWQVTLENPDIGESAIAVRVTLAVDGRMAVFESQGVLQVDPVFDCNSAASMAPDNDLIQNMSTEQRVMVGYFGDPDGGHSVAFVIDANDDNGDHYSVVGTTVRYGSTQIEASWNVSRLRCNTNNGNCNTSYDLTVFVDGVQLCSKVAFGNVLRYN